MGTRSFLGVKRPRRGTDHPPPSSTKVKERVELYLYSPSGSSWTVLGWALPFTFTFSEKRLLCFTSVQNRHSYYKHAAKKMALPAVV
jgi:hypothetical protein